MPQQPQNFAWSETEAQARIETARCDGATSLDLSGLRLRALPEAVLDLPGLRELNLSNNRLRDVPGVSLRLTGLTGLDRRWGGLSRTVTPEGLTLYLCRDHADAYRRAVRL